MKSFIRSKKLIIFILAGCTLLLCDIFLTGCATQPPPDTTNPPGFFLGLVHGLIIVFSFIASLFTDCRIYAFPNSGL